MKREWKPGDVAMVLLADEWRRAMRTGVPGNMGWELASPTRKRWCSDDALDLRDDEIRPVAVIDPESREQVERLHRLILRLRCRCGRLWLQESPGCEWHKSRHDRAVESRPQGSFEGLDDALREYADPKPPKPEEPTRWLAAVEDRGGNRWAIAGGPIDGDRRWYSPDLNTTRAYADIDAVRVLSEGVTE